MDAFVTMPLRISATLAARIDEHWHAERLMSRAAAIRDILERGLSRPAPQVEHPPSEVDPDGERAPVD